MEAIAEAVGSSPTAELVALIERAIGHVVKVILKADDSNGLRGDLARELLDLHARACDTGSADPIELARWMVRFRFDDQDFFEVDPVRYADALGQLGLEAYRRGVKAGVEAGGRLVRIAETSGWQVARLDDLAAGVHTRRGEDQEVLRLRREQHQRMPSSSTYSLLRTEAQACGVWLTERPLAREVLAEHHLGDLIDVLLSDGEPEAAWQVPGTHPDWDPGRQRWMRLAEAREASASGDALDVYLRLADLQLKTTVRASGGDPEEGGSGNASGGAPGYLRAPGGVA